MDKQQRPTKKTQVYVPLASYLPWGWASTNKRGRPGKSIILFQAQVINEPDRMLLPPIEQPTVVRMPQDLPPKKRNPQLLHIQDDDAQNHYSYPNKKIIITGDHNIQPSNKRKAVLVVGGGSSEVHERLVQEAHKFHACCTCGKRFDTYFALGGHRSNHKKRENKLRRANPLLATVQYEQRIEPIPMPMPMPRRENLENECKKCKRRFMKPQGLAAHSRLCPKRGNQQRYVQDFDLNLLPAEAFLPEVISRITMN